MSVSHLAYFIIGILICVSDLKRIYPSTKGVLRRTNFIISIFYSLYSLYQILLLLLWIFLVNKVKVGDERIFPSSGTMENPKTGFWLSVAATFCQAYATVIRLVMTVTIKN